jgi:hypothetical protein
MSNQKTRISQSATVMEEAKTESNKKATEGNHKPKQKKKEEDDRNIQRTIRVLLGSTWNVVKSERCIVLRWRGEMGGT